MQAGSRTNVTHWDARGRCCGESWAGGEGPRAAGRAGKVPSEGKLRQRREAGKGQAVWVSGRSAPRRRDRRATAGGHVWLWDLRPAGVEAAETHSASQAGGHQGGLLGVLQAERQSRN